MAKIIDKRKEIREEGSTKVLVASYGTLSTGKLGVVYVSGTPSANIPNGIFLCVCLLHHRYLCTRYAYHQLSL